MLLVSEYYCCEAGAGHVVTPASSGKVQIIMTEKPFGYISQFNPSLWQYLSQGVWRNRVLIGLIGLHFVATLAAGQISEVPFKMGTFNALSLLFGLLLPCFVIVIFIWRFCYMAVRVQPKRPIRWFARDLWRIFGDGNRLIEGGLTLLMLAVFTGSFSYFKEIIPQLNPFSWDPALARLDVILHGGVAPYQYLMQVFGTPRLVSMVNAAYQAWFFVMFFVVFLACFTTESDQQKTRNTLLVAFVLTWALGGNIMATVFSSGGPVYFEKLGFGTDFTQLNTTLAEFDRIILNPGLKTQDMLWQGYAYDGSVAGISAMPSMHMASATLLALYGFRRAQWAGWLLTGFAAVIAIGAVLLAWHYAVDVYAGVLLALLCWFIAVRLTGEISRMSVYRALNEAAQD